MHIRIIIQWSRNAPARRSFKVRNVFRHVKCLAIGHDEEVVLGDRALAVRCRECGWTSPGLTLDTQRPGERPN
jgi:ribosomal protein S27E